MCPRNVWWTTHILPEQENKSHTTIQMLQLQWPNITVVFSVCALMKTPNKKVRKVAKIQPCVCVCVCACVCVCVCVCVDAWLWLFCWFWAFLVSFHSSCLFQGFFVWQTGDPLSENTLLKDNSFLWARWQTDLFLVKDTREALSSDHRPTRMLMRDTTAPLWCSPIRLIPCGSLWNAMTRSSKLFSAKRETETCLGESPSIFWVSFKLMFLLVIRVAFAQTFVL